MSKSCFCRESQCARVWLPRSLTAAARFSLATGQAPGSSCARSLCDHYAESGGGPPDGVYPVFVSVLKARLSSPDALRIEVAQLTAAVAVATGRLEDHIHIVYLPAGAGRVAFGGNLVPAA